MNTQPTTDDLTDDQRLRYNTTLVQGLQDTIEDGKEGLDGVPKYIRKVLNEDAWEIRVLPDSGEVVEFDTFTDFVEAHPPKGLGTTVETLKNMCQQHEEVCNLILDETTGAAAGHGEIGNGRSEKSRVDNVNSNSDGNSESYALRRLKRDAPELAEKVTSGEMSANAAAIEAGFRTKNASIPIHKGGEPQIERAAERLAKHFGEDVQRLVDELQRHA